MPAFRHHHAAFFEVAAVLCVLLASVISGAHAWFLDKSPTALDRPGVNHLNLGISAMIATGRGFVQPVGNGIVNEYPSAPRLQQFLRNEIPSLSPGDIPADLGTYSPRGDWEYRHRYLYTLVGVLWRVFGISWAVVKALRILFFCVMMISVYAVFRLAMNRPWSLTATFFVLLASDTLSYSQNIRDFSKGAFFLPAVFLTGWLVTRPCKVGTLMLAAGFLGILTGVGIGFRTDVMMCLPPALLGILFCPLVNGRGAIRTRLASLAIFVLVFCGFGAPILSAGWGTGINAYDAILGCSTLFSDNLHLGRTSYEKMPVNDDDLIGAAIDSRAARLEETRIPTSSQGENRRIFFRDMVLDFPADMLVRFYAAALWVLRLDNGSLRLDFIPALCAVLLAAAAWKDPRRAWLLFLLTMYFCGYVCLQTDYRHKFHLFLIPVLVVFLPCSVIAQACWRRMRGRGMPPPTGKGGRANWRRRAAGMTAFLLSAALLIALPFPLLRAWQHHRLAKVVPLYTTARLERVETDEERLGDWTLFQRRVHEPAHSGMRPTGFVTAEYWVAEFAPSPSWRPVWIQYQHSADGLVTYSHGFHITPSKAGDDGPVRYFFPVYEEQDLRSDRWKLFCGVAVPRTQAADFRGLFRVTDAEKFPWFMNFSLPSDLSALVLSQRLDGLDPSLDTAVRARYWFSGRDPRFLLPQIGHPPPDIGECLASYRREAAKAPGNAFLRVGLGAALAAAGDRDAALEAYREALRMQPRHFIVYHYVDALLGGQDGAGRRVELWREMVSAHPGQYLPHFHLARALEDLGDVPEAVVEYERALEIQPEDIETLKHAGLLFDSLGMPSEADGLFTRARALDPADTEISAFFLGRTATNETAGQ
ncbi:MAG TPA: hypothetical protein PKN23_01530 [Candidatus Hydrogenedentes bacterium]|nr:hypothetical protein [Candidatus Hydrogenedentota bacterium]HQL93809.1 hypothetical protein [Candidatus Hydrogenedentota bacterium]